jgi:7,8-dihydropterin-6-yl-methyl-4-(beta-D-ribofuranosyl)aminobenzene 5'-phosphate synthase
MDGSSARPVPLDELTLTVLVDNETDTLSSVDDGVDQLPEVASLLARLQPTRRHAGHDCVTVFDQLCVACHGLSVLATGRVGETTDTVLFDVGPYGDVWLDNAGRLGVDLAAIGTIFLSHWHWDHSGGLPDVISAVAAARRRAGHPPPIVDVHPDRPDQRGIQSPAGMFVLLPEEPTIDALQAAGGVVRMHPEDHLLAGDVSTGDDAPPMFLGSGFIERSTSYETGLVGHHSFRFGVGPDGGDEVTADPLIEDERFLAAEVRGRGVSVLSACSHAGIVNACLGAMQRFPDAAIDVVLGGYHLAGAAMEARIGATVDDLDVRVRPRIVAPGHCTGWRAKAALADRFAPGRYGPSVVGTTYRLQGR